MIIRKPVNILNGEIAADKSWEKIGTSASGEPIQSYIEKADRSNIKGLIKLVLGVLYFLSLVSSLTMLLT